MSEIAITIICTVIGYLVGSLSPSIYVAKFKGVDIKSHGSKNAGSTNVLRVLGIKVAALVFILDLLKGFVVVFLVALIVGPTISYFSGIGAILGHCFSVYHKFKAGKGVATGFGVMLAINWMIALCVFGVALLMFLITRRVSVGSICAVITLPIFAYYFQYDFFFFSIAIALIVIFTHRANIMRIFRGQEPPIEFKSKKCTK